MVRHRKKYLGLFLVVLVVAGAAGGWYWHEREWKAGALWRIVSEKCVPGEQKNHNPAPCKEVNLQQGYVLLKDLNGPLQFLLMPVERITGIESPELLSPTTPNFFWDAWHERGVMAEKRGAPIPDTAISLAINSPTGRTQNQLHIHISCLRNDIRQAIDKFQYAVGAQWQPFPDNLAGEEWLARTLTPEELQNQSLFINFAQQVGGAAKQMGHFSLALVALKSGKLLALATERDLLHGNPASAEVLQDHTCAILTAPETQKP
ncbi:CDP-diacylglycerol diphosphatase [Mangrovibacter plantisponsor]|uniref:CDP-diacylglycerol pyrophosphatase n=1 Tax=Mangrovibacter plantisponsor TaxID=451513 RepID=A0A317PX50_9ENTR|nr:CDP-diacylglycerol diphosphatase [Mangrovibacter plantisponsor]PWW05333.1 CDP-diacylglycerol pyrophosphatase [Mangrovibacter plantisponsor]